MYRVETEVIGELIYDMIGRKDCRDYGREIADQTQLENIFPSCLYHLPWCDSQAKIWLKNISKYDVTVRNVWNVHESFFL